MERGNGNEACHAIIPNKVVIASERLAKGAWERSKMTWLNRSFETSVPKASIQLRGDLDQVFDIECLLTSSLRITELSEILFDIGQFHLSFIPTDEYSTNQYFGKS